VLATHNAGQPHASRIALAGPDDLHFLNVVTPRTASRFSNPRDNGCTELLITSSASQETDFHEGMAVTVLGRAGDISVAEKEAALRRYPDRHSSLDDAVRSSACAMVKASACTPIQAENFQDTMELHIEP
jgi:hypothetical protein